MLLCSYCQKNLFKFILWIYADFIVIHIDHPKLQKNRFFPFWLASICIPEWVLKATTDCSAQVIRSSPQMHALVICRQSWRGRKGAREGLIALSKHQQACIIFIDLLRVVLIGDRHSGAPLTGSSTLSALLVCYRHQRISMAICCS